MDGGETSSSSAAAAAADVDTILAKNNSSSNDCGAGGDGTTSPADHTSHSGHQEPTCTAANVRFNILIVIVPSLLPC